MFGNCQTGCLQYSMTNSDSTAKTFNCLPRDGKTTSSRIAAALFILAKYLRFPTAAGRRLCLWASICLRVSFYALINFRLAEVPHQLLCGCAAASADFLFAYLPRLNQHIHTHTRHHSTHSQPQRTKSPNTFLLGIYTHPAGRSFPFLPSLTSSANFSPLIVCAISFVATWPAASPIYQPNGPTLLPALVALPLRFLRFASLRSFVCLCLFVDTIWLHCLLTISDLLLFVFFYFLFFYIGCGLC